MLPEVALGAKLDDYFSNIFRLPLTGEFLLSYLTIIELVLNLPSSKENKSFDVLKGVLTGIVCS